MPEGKSVAIIGVIGVIAAAFITVLVPGILPKPDTTAPSITPPPDIRVTDSDNGKTYISLGAPIVSDDKDPNPSIANNAPSDGLFDIGTHPITWTATDKSGNSKSAIQTVVVNPHPPKPVPTKMFKVRFDTVYIHESHDPVGAGEWYLTAYVNSQPLQLLQNEGADQNELLEINNPNDVDHYLGGERSVRVTVPENGAITVKAQGYESDSPTSDGIGVINYECRGPQFCVGQPIQVISQYNGIDDDSAGDYTLTFTVQQVS